jgi:hypothetical protein
MQVPAVMNLHVNTCLEMLRNLSKEQYKTSEQGCSGKTPNIRLVFLGVGAGESIEECRWSRQFRDVLYPN